MDRFESLSAFVAVAKARGFTAAARALGIPLATINRRVVDLERALGVRLLHRSTRQVALTEIGQSFFATCQRVLDDLKEAEDAATGEYRTPKGELSVTAPTGFGRLHLQPVALEFLAAYPDINLKLLLVDRMVHLSEEHIDLALRIAELPDSSLAARPLGHIKMVVSASPAYLQRRGTPEHPADLMRHDCIAWSSVGPLNSWWFRERESDVTYPVHTRLSTTSADSALAAAEAGLGLVQTTSYQAAAGLEDGSLVVVLREFECAPTPVSLVYASQRQLPLKVREFIDFVVPRLAVRLQSVAATVESSASASCNRTRKRGAAKSRSARSFKGRRP
jgi:DNA-binding transcriptional LysR family regulator